MWSTVAVWVGAWVMLLGAPSVLTAVGARRRGNRAAVAVLLGLCFPLTWALWYAADEPGGGQLDGRRRS